MDRFQWNLLWVFSIKGALFPCITFPHGLWHSGVIALCYSKITYFFPSNAISLKLMDRFQRNLLWVLSIKGVLFLCITFPHELWHSGVIALCYSKITYFFRPMPYLCNGLTDFNETWKEYLLSLEHSSYVLLF